MKKLFLLGIILFCFLSTNAQLNFGLKGGYNSSLTFDNIALIQTGGYNLNNVKSELANGFHAGVFGRVFIDKFYIQPELLYSLQKKEYQITMKDIANKDVTVDKFISFSTVDIPLLLGFKVLDLKVANLRVFAGPKLRLNVGSEISFPNLTDADGIDKKKLMGEFKNSQIGLEIGAGIDVLMLALDVKFNLIDDIYKASWETRPEANSNFIISLGWKLF